MVYLKYLKHKRLFIPLSVLVVYASLKSWKRRLIEMSQYSFSNKGNRDAFARVQKAYGYIVRKTGIKNQLCDPRYLRDYDEFMNLED